MSRNLDSHRKGESGRAVARVLNRTTTKGRTLIVRKASKALDVKQKHLRNRVRVSRANSKTLRAKLWVGLQSLRAVSLGAKRSESGYAVGPYAWSNAFKFKGKDGKQHIMHRKGRERYPIIHAALGKEFVSGEMKKATDQEVNKVVNRDLKAELHRELSYRMDKVMGA